MARVVKSCLQSFLKLMNSIIGMAGMAMIIYALWMIRIWLVQMNEDSNSPAPWFIYASLGLGIFLCVVTCSGYIAAETSNNPCLSCYMVFVFLLLLLEAVVAGDVFLNHDWEEDFPEDPTGRFDKFKDFVRSNVEICSWIGMLIVIAQGLSILLAMILRALGPDQGRYSDSDDDYVPVRLPLLKNPPQPAPYVVGQPHFASKNDGWISRTQEKTNR